MDRHGLTGWSLRLSSARRRLGSCAYHTRTIRLSRYLLTDNRWPQVHDTLLHEIAHALVGPNHGHDRVWKQMAVKLGAAPRSCTKPGEVVMPQGGWVAWCLTCQKEVARYHRRPAGWRRGYRHQACGGTIRFRSAATDPVDG